MPVQSVSVYVEAAYLSLQPGAHGMKWVFHHAGIHLGIVIRPLGWRDSASRVIPALFICWNLLHAMAGCAQATGR